MIGLPTVSRKEPKNSKLVQSADDVQRVWDLVQPRLSPDAPPFFKSEGIGLAKDNSELVLPCITFELGHSDLVRQRPTRTGTFTFIVVVDSSSVKYGVCW